MGIQGNLARLVGSPLGNGTGCVGAIRAICALTPHQRNPGNRRNPATMQGSTVPADRYRLIFRKILSIRPFVIMSAMNRSDPGARALSSS